MNVLPCSKDSRAPTPKTDEVLIKVAAASLNFRDNAIVDGIYEPKMIPKPLIPVSDAAGVVSVGKNVTPQRGRPRQLSSLLSLGSRSSAGLNRQDAGDARVPLVLRGTSRGVS
jgi:NADPH:quinone reductase-like Zn-dependent oxidoreductase